MFRFLMDRLRNEFFSSPDSFDRQFGIETRRTVWRKRLSVAEDSTGYQAVDPQTFARAAAHAPRSTFLDLGCGKGRALVLAHRSGFTKLIGVEMSGDLASVARENLERLGIKAEILEENAASYRFPDEPLVVFMYNPFGRPTLEIIVDKLLAHPYPTYILYVTPLHGDCFRQFETIHSDENLMVLRSHEHRPA